MLLWQIYVSCIITTYVGLYVGRDSSVGLATCYELDGPGIESRWGEIFRTRLDRFWGPPIFLYNGYRVFPAGKVTGATPSSAEVKERVELYLYSTFGPSWGVLGRALPLYAVPIKCPTLR